MDKKKSTTDKKSLPANSETLAADSENIPADSENLPADSENLPADSENLPADNKNSTFEATLAEFHEWPCCYDFKFIATDDNLPELLKIFDGHTLIKRPSRTGKYTSVTVSVPANNVEEIMHYYKQTADIKGLINL